jgi:hypothetical protein
VLSALRAVKGKVTRSESASEREGQKMRHGRRQTLGSEQRRTCRNELKSEDKSLKVGGQRVPYTVTVVYENADEKDVGRSNEERERENEVRVLRWSRK